MSSLFYKKSADHSFHSRIRSSFSRQENITRNCRGEEVAVLPFVLNSRVGARGRSQPGLRRFELKSRRGWMDEQSDALNRYTEGEP